MAKQHHKPTTLDGLAIMIDHGFTEPQKHIDKRLDEIQGDMPTKGGLNEVKQTMKDMLEKLNATHEDVRYIRNTVNMPVRSDAAHSVAAPVLSRPGASGRTPCSPRACSRRTGTTAARP